MNGVEVVESRGQVLCYIVRAEFQPDETTFLTPTEENLQVGYIVYSSGNDIPRHVHNPVRHWVEATSEVLMVRKGRLTVDLYSDERLKVASRELNTGDVIILVGGGHGFKTSEDTVLLEVKQGPYRGVDEKVRF